MKIRFAVCMALAPLAALSLTMLVNEPVSAQQRGEEHHDNVHANQGHIPQAPPQRSNPSQKPDVDRREGGRVNSMPHVHNDHWYGHDAPNDKRYVIAHPFEHGHFEHFGASYRYHVERVDVGAHRFWFPGGFSFVIAPWDWDLAAGWCWDCSGDNFVVYEDSDHPGWYVIYNVQTGVYAHAQYMGM